MNDDNNSRGSGNISSGNISSGNITPPVFEAPEIPTQNIRSLRSILARAKREGLAEKEAKRQEQQRKALLRGTGFTKRALRRASVEVTDSAVEASERARAEMLDSLGVVPDSLRDDSIILDESQQEAVDGLSEARCGCLIGPAGSGKTTTEKELVERLGITEREYRLNETELTAIGNDPAVSMAFKGRAKIAACAFTGKAVQQMKRNLPAWLHPYCDTAHGWLGYAPEYVEKWNQARMEYVNVRIFRPTFTAVNKLDLDYLIVDEAGMMPVYLWNQLMAALPAHTRIYCVGDINQLPPVHGRSVLGFAMLKWPTFELRKVHRTDEGSIIDNAHRILQGRPVIADGKTTAKKLIKDRPSEAAIEVCGILSHLYDRGRFDPMQDVLITPTNKGDLGQQALNEYLVRVFNPIRYESGIAVNPRTAIRTARESHIYAVGDKVMLLKNKRDLGLTNGQVGVVMELHHNLAYKGEVVDDFNLSGGGLDGGFSFGNLGEIAESATNELMNVQQNTAKDDDDLNQRAASHVMTVKFQNVAEPLELRSTGDFSGIAHAYAMTCHKMQGSEARKVFVIVHSAQLNMLCREWYYTAVTRAQEKLVILHNRRGEQHAVNAQKLKGETLEDKALAFIEASGKDDVLQPELPDPAL